MIQVDFLSLHLMQDCTMSDTEGLFALVSKKISSQRL